MPVCGVFVTSICLTLIVIYRKNIATLLRAKSNVKVEAQHSKPNDRLKLPKSKINDFKTLINMGFDKKDIVTALNETKTIGFALDRLTAQNETRIDSKDGMDSKEKMDRTHGSNLDDIDQNNEDNENYVYLGEF